MSRSELERLSREELIELVLRLQRPEKTSRTSSKPPSTDRKAQRERSKPGGAKLGHDGHSRVMSDRPGEIVEHRPRPVLLLRSRADRGFASRDGQRARADRAAGGAAHCRASPAAGGALSGLWSTGCGGTADSGARHPVRPTPARGGDLPENLPGAVLYARLQDALSDLFGLRLSQGGLMNLLRRAQGRFESGQTNAVSALRRAEVIASDETGVRIEGSNAYHWVFRCPEAVVHHAAPTRAASVVRTMMDGHRPAVWLSDRYSAQQGHAPAQQTCLAHLARDVAYAAEVSDDPVPWRLQLCMLSVGRGALRGDPETVSVWRDGRDGADLEGQLNPGWL